MKGKVTALTAGVLVALAGAGALGAAIATVVPRGQGATFANDPLHWYCLNGGRFSPNAITCTSGDARPYAELSKRVISVRVSSLRRACLKRVLRPPIDPGARPYYEYVYTFKAVGRC